jgi:hypothetical protein
MRKIELGLEGAFKLDLYSGSQFHSTSDWFNNFITVTGLMMPTGYAFADCFRFLSLGSSNTVNQGATGIGQLGTTGLVSAILPYRTSLGTSQSATYIGWEGYATGTTESNCGTTLTESGPRFYRAWHIPTGHEEVTVNVDGADGLDIRELAVHPSSGTDAGIGKYAFSRVVRNLFIPNGFRAIVSYQLKVNIRNTGATYLPPGSFNISNAEVSNDAVIVNRWANLSGYYRQVYFGLRAVDNLGFTYVPRFGDGMEPSSRNLSRMIWYLSPDNSQFDVNGLGGPQTLVAKAYNADGLMFHIGRNDLSLDFRGVVTQETEGLDHSTLNSTYTNTSITSVDFPENISSTLEGLANIRLGSDNSFLSLPQLGNYKVADADPANFNYQIKQDVSTKEISYATPGTGQFSTFYTDFGKLASVSSNTSRLPVTNRGTNSETGRRKTITRRSTFSPVSSLGYNTRFGSLVYAYEAAESEASAGSRKYWPMIDCQFIDSSGRYMLPHYRFVSGIYLTDRGTGVLESSLFLTGNVGGNIRKFISYRTFQGGYSANLNHWLTGAAAKLYADNDIDPSIYLRTGASGFLATGVSLSPSVSGVTGVVSLGTANYASGWGSVYGIIVDSGFWDYENQPDLVLSDHSLSGLGEPNVTGKVYWPYVAPEYEVKLIGSGLKFWTPEFGNTETSVFADSGGWFSKTRQIIKDIKFDRLNGSYQPIASTDYAKTVTGFTGFILTTGRFDGTAVSMNQILNSTTNFGFTGYAVPFQRNTAGQLKGTSWVDAAGAIPSDSLQFIPTTTTLTLGGVAGNPIIRRVNALFSSWSDRGFPNGTGGTPFKAGDLAHVFFTGYSGNPTSKSGLYLTYISGNASNQMIGYSYMSGVVQLTDFAPPTGHPMHTEAFGASGYRLATNFAPANFYGEDIYTAISGGEYPALSLDNGLEMYLDISWSSPCGPTTTNCNDPS